MSQAERIKETLGRLKIVFGALVAVDVSLVLAVVAVAGTITGIVGVNHAAFRLAYSAEYVGGDDSVCTRGSMGPATAGRFGGLPGLRPHPPYIDLFRYASESEAP